MVIIIILKLVMSKIFIALTPKPEFNKVICGLKDDQKKLRSTIKKFEKDELEHHDIGISHDAEKTPGYKILSKVIELGCKTAIKLSKKI